MNVSFVIFFRSLGMYVESKKKPKKNRRKYLKPCKYNEMANLDLDKIRLERYFMPVALEVEGAAGKGKLDKKVVEVEEDISDFYLNSRAHLRSAPLLPPKKGSSDLYFKYDYQYAYENERE